MTRPLPHYQMTPPDSVNAPYLEKSNMFMAWQAAAMRLETFCARVEEWNTKFDWFFKENGKPVESKPIGIQPKDLTISYSQATNALRIDDEKHNVRVTCHYNVWDNQRNEYVDLAYFRPLDEKRPMGDGYLFKKGVGNGSFIIQFDTTGDDYSERRKHGEISFEQDCIAGALCRELIAMHRDGILIGIGRVPAYEEELIERSNNKDVEK